MEKRLDGYHENYIGDVKNPVTEKQQAILDCIRDAHGNNFVPNLTNSLQAWNFIKLFEEYIKEVDGVWEIDELDVSNVKKFMVVNNDIFIEVSYDIFGEAIKPKQNEIDEEELAYWKEVEEAEEKYLEMQRREYLDRYDPGDDFETDWIRSLE